MSTGVEFENISQQQDKQHEEEQKADARKRCKQQDGAAIFRGEELQVEGIFCDEEKQDDKRKRAQDHHGRSSVAVSHAGRLSPQ